MQRFFCGKAAGFSPPPLNAGRFISISALSIAARCPALCGSLDTFAQRSSYTLFSCVGMLLVAELVHVADGFCIAAGGALCGKFVREPFPDMKIAAPVAAAAKRSLPHHFIIVPEVSQLKQPCFLCFIAIILHFLLKLTDVSCRTPAAGRIPAPVPVIGSRTCSCSPAPERLSEKAVRSIPFAQRKAPAAGHFQTGQRVLSFI